MDKQSTGKCFAIKVQVLTWRFVWALSQNQFYEAGFMLLVCSVCRVQEGILCGSPGHRVQVGM